VGFYSGEATPFLGHLEPLWLLRAMPHAHQPEQDEHRRLLLPRKLTDQTPNHPPPSWQTQAREHTSARLSPCTWLQPPTNLVPGSRAESTRLPPAPHYHRPSIAIQRTAVGTGRHWNSSDVTVGLYNSKSSASLLAFVSERRTERERGKGRAKSCDTYGAAEQEQCKLPRLFVPRPFRCAPATTTAPP
jgi:hypothetical protein